ncbi:MAG TPA: PQQ-dependent sugar dehydrogenase, partial [Anaerolineae bacterium]
TLGVEPVASGFAKPVHLTHAGDDRLFVVEQAGRIRIVEDGQVLETPFLDIASLVRSTGNEQGLLSVAFHPQYASNGEFFVDYTRNPDGATVVARYRVSGDPNVADPDSAEVLLTIDQPEPNHNGGLLLFGPDGYLYIGTGDGGGAGDRHGAIGNGQDPQALLGKILRIDVDQGDPYAIPASNPFADGANGRPEVWAYGLRNPWRFSFDRATGDLYIADVGQGTYEEVDFQPASSAGGVNYGWRIMEGMHCYSPRDGCDQTGLMPPVAEYTHDSGCSVTGGYVYRGSDYPWLDGVYVFADYCSGIVWSLERDAAGQWQMTERLDVDFSVSSFGEDRVGELYLAGRGDGTIYRLASTSP